MRLRRHFLTLGASALLLGAGALAALAWSVLQTRQLAHAQHQAVTIAREVTGLLVLTQDYLLHAEPRARQQWLARFRRLDEAWTAAPGGRGEPRGERYREQEEQLRLLPVLFDELQQLPRPNEATPFELRRRELAVDRLLTVAQAVADQAYDRERQLTGRRDAAEYRLMALAVALPGLLALLFAAASALIARRVLRPLHRLGRSMEAVAAGEPPLGEGGGVRDEIGELAQRFARLTDQLAERSGALRASESMLRMVTDNLPAMIGYWGRDQLNRFANADYRRWFGRGPEQIRGRHIAELLGPELYEKNRPFIEGALAGRRQDFDRSIPGPDGVLRHSQASYIPDAHDGRVDGFFVLVTDVTERVHAEQALARALAEKETLLKEVYHRVKNNLQVVQSLLNIQSRSVGDDSARDALRETAQRVRAMALVHEQLYRGSDLSSLSLPTYVRDLVRHLDDGAGRAAGEVRIATDVADLRIGLDAAVPLGLLLTELVSNGLKHAFPSGRDGTIRVEIQPVEGGRVRIAVADDGQGLPAGFDPTHAVSLGLQLADSLARQLGGALHFDATPGGGTTVSASIPMP